MKSYDPIRAEAEREIDKTLRKMYVPQEDIQQRGDYGLAWFLVSLAIVMLLLVATAAWAQAAEPRATVQEEMVQEEMVEVVEVQRRVIEEDTTARMPVERPYVVDGDTLRLPSTGETIRIIGIDTPEIYSPHCQTELIAGNAATGRLHFLLRKGNVSVIRYSRPDKYGRTLARVFVGDAEVAKVLIQEGYGVLYDGKTRRTHWRDTLCPGVPLNSSAQGILR
jgi:endonuclease YncB( thermonuclease family)